MWIRAMNYSVFRTVWRRIASNSSLSKYLHSSSCLTQNVIEKSSALETVNNEIEIPDPLKHPDFFEVHNIFTVKDLFDARVHFGHTNGTLNDNMRQFILGSRLETLIIDLDQTAELLKQALNFAAHIAFRKGIILFAGKYKQNTQIIEKTALECGEYAHTRDFTIGTFTETNKFGSLTRFPDLVIIFNTLDNVFETHPSVLASNKLLIPTIGIVDTNCFPNYITYPVPGNDDSPVAVELYCKLLKTAILKGKQKRKELEEKYGDVFY